MLMFTDSWTVGFVSMQYNLFSVSSISLMKLNKALGVQAPIMGK